MSDPERFLKNPPTVLSRLLLRAGAEEKPSAAALTRTTRAVAAAAATGTFAKAARPESAGAKLGGASAAPAMTTGSAAGAGATAGTNGATIGAMTVLKWVGIGALSVAIALPVVQRVMRARAPKYTQPYRAGSAATPRPSATEAALPSVPKSLELVRSDPSSEPRPALAQAGQNPRNDAARRAAKPKARAAQSSALLAAEVQLVDRGRAAFERGAFAETLAALAPYEERFPQQQLLTEVLFLRMEAFSRLGDVDRARSLAGRVITRGVTGAQAARAREMLAR